MWLHQKEEMKERDFVMIWWYWITLEKKNTFGFCGTGVICEGSSSSEKESKYEMWIRRNEYYRPSLFVIWASFNQFWFMEGELLDFLMQI
jgi:hypothetical protein